jgi:tetratricopeptide (TPR) repeat protein
VDSGRFQLKASRLIRETAIEWVRMDRYDIAKANLDRIQDIRNHDPKTLWYLGRVYKLIARTDGDKNKALDFFQRAQAADQRNLYPEIQRDYAFMLAERTGGAGTAQAVELLKRYVMVYVQSTGAHPPDLESIYDYLLLFGDGAWTAPKVDRRIVAERAPETRP